MGRIRPAKRDVNAQWLHHYEVVGRKRPADDEASAPKLWRMEIFAPNRVLAKSRFHYFLNRQQCVKKSKGVEILGIREIHEKRPLCPANYAVAIRCRSKHSITNLTKEFRDVSALGAVEQMYHEMAARHRARFYDIQVTSVGTRSKEQVKRPAVAQMLDPSFLFPRHRLVRKRLVLNSASFRTRNPSTFS